MRRWTLVVLISVLAMVVSTGCKRPNEYDKDKDIPYYVNPTPEDLRDVYGLMITIHGCPLEAMNVMLREGLLPNIKKHVIDRGATVKNGVCCFPSLSSPNGPAIFLGRFPGHIGIPGLQWVDRKPHFYKRNYLGVDYQKSNVDFYTGRATEYDLQVNRKGAPVPLCARVRPYKSATFQEFFSAGSTERKYFIASILRDELFAKTRTRTDTKVLNAVKKCYKRPMSKIPRLICVDLLGFDIMGHHTHPLHKRTKNVLINTDKHLGEIVKVLKKRDLWKKTYIVLFSDHGNKNLNRYRKREKMAMPLFLKKHEMKSMRDYRNEKFNVVSTSSGANIALLYFADYNVSAVGVNYTWDRKPSLARLRDYAVSRHRKIDLVKILIDDGRVKFVLAKDADKNIRIFTKDTEAVIKRRIFMGEAYFLYQKVRGKVDPFEYLKFPELKKMIVSGEYFSDKQWLEKSLKTHYPYAVPNVFQIFDTRRAGNLIVVGADHVLMKNAVYNSTHGALSRTDILVPMFFSGPDIKRKVINTARVIDIYPTWMRIFGLKVPFQNIDGDPLDSILPDKLVRNTDSRVAYRKRFSSLVKAVWDLENKNLAKVNNPSHNVAFETLRRAPRADLEKLREYWQSEIKRISAEVEKLSEENKKNINVNALLSLPRRYVDIVNAVLSAKK